MKNIINAESLTQFKEHIELGISSLQDQQLPVNLYTFGFLVQELNKYIAELEHPRYLTYVTGDISETKNMVFYVHVGDKFNQDNWIETIQFNYPRNSVSTTDPAGMNPTPAKITHNPVSKTIIPVPKIDTFESEVKTMEVTRRKGYTVNRSKKRRTVIKYSSYTEYINFVKVLYNECLGCTECLNKSLIAAFLGSFDYPEAFISNGKTLRQHLKLKDDIEFNETVMNQFSIDWSYFIDNWSDNAITVAQYKTADSTRMYKSKHKPIDLVEQRIGNFEYELTDLGKVIWEKVHALLGFFEDVPKMETEQKEEPAFEKIEETDGTVVGDIEVMAAPTAAINRLGAEEQLEEHFAEKVEEAKVVHMGYAKCNGCIFLDKHRKWCNKRFGFIDTLVHEECFESERPELEVAPVEEVEKICFNCKRWHSGNNPGNLKAIACRCPVQGRKTLTDHTCAKFVAIIKKED
jgi:hypothetical protein